ncbi:MAG: hypothetical protein ISR75_05120 [Phycisphaerales bacterium]|nr:hypothetical protein [Planctomycetota bacterium]MBL6997800.1 hypothetical protein [Phycisphaerales bacterium]
MLTICLTTTLFYLQEPEPLPDRNWRTPTEISEQVSALDNNYESVTSSIIGYSGSGLPIHCLEIAREGSVPIKDRTAILVVAGIDGDHLLGTEVAVDLVSKVLTQEPEKSEALLTSNKLYVIPQVNPDSAKFYFNEVKHQQQRTPTPFDNDHDGVKDEDGFEDLNGDGFITMMRVPDLEKANLLADVDNPRLEIKPNPLDGNVASFIVYTEGIDNDGDGKYNEDGVGGVDLNKNFMHGYEYHGDGAGHWQLCESESRALADFVLNHQEIASIIVYGHHDTLSKPFTESGKDEAGAPKKLAEEDVELYKHISKRFVELTELKDVNQPNWDGSFVAWAYAQYGVPSFSTSLWTRPELNKEGNKEQKTEDKSDANTENNELTTSSVGDISQETLDELLQAAEAAGFPVTEEMMEGITPEDIEMYAKMSGVQIKRVKEKDAGNKSNSEDVAWLVYSDEQRDRNGFIEWSTFDHPQLGTVEIGGWVPYFKTLPPTDEIDSITEKQVGFINDIANRLPKIQLSTPTVTKLGNNIWEIKVAVVNNGWFPTGTAMAKKNKRARPLVVRLDVPNDTIVSGQKVNRIWSLQGSGTRQWYKWILKGKPEKKVTITLFSEKFGSKTISVSLKNTDGGDA